jgi:hypothetical protein
MTRTYSRGHRTAPWLHAEHLAGFLLGLALAAMAIDHGMRTAPSSALPLTPVRTTGP